MVYIQGHHPLHWYILLTGELGVLPPPRPLSLRRRPGPPAPSGPRPGGIPPGPPEADPPAGP